MKDITIKKVLFGAILAVTLVTSGWSLATMLIDFGMPWQIAIGTVLVYDGSAVYYGKTAMEYATTDDSGAYEKFMTWLMVLASVGINGYHGWMVSPAYGIVLGSIPLATGTLYHSSLKQGNLVELRRKGRLTRGMPKFPFLHWILFTGKTYKHFKSIAEKRLDTLAERAMSEEDSIKEDVFPVDVEKEAGKWETLAECVRENLDEFPSLNKMAGFVEDIFPDATRKQISTAMSREKGGND